MRPLRTALPPSSILFTFTPFLAFALCIVLLSSLGFAAAPDRITAPIISQQSIRLSGTAPREALAQYDRGPVDPSLNLSYMTLVTVPSASQQKALSRLLAQQQDPHSPQYRKWLTPEQYADRFGLSPTDIRKLTLWLQSQGFAIVRTARGRNWIVFAGTAAQVEKTFQTEIHKFEMNGESHFSNTSAPTVPAAFSGIVANVRGLNDFRPKSQLQHIQPGYTYPANGGSYLFIAPGDVKTIYDINTLYQNGIDGTGQTLAVIGETGIFQSDLTNFRQNFGLSPIHCTVNNNDIITACNTSNFKYVLVNGTATSVYRDLPEADIDIEWSGATARNAQIIFVTSNQTNVWDSWYYAVDNDIAPVMTMSYTAPCEIAEAQNSGTGVSTIAGDEAELAKANAEGITFLNSSGDTGAAECDFQSGYAEYGYAVAYPASSQYVTGVGGTLLPYTEYTQTYFGNSNSGSDGGSALQYIPEQAWNDSLEFAYFCEANKTDGFCTNYGVGGGPLNTDWANMQENVLGISAGGGGVSNCVALDANGVCQSGFPQPSWQAGLNLSAINPGGLGQVNSTPARLSPDVSLMASANWPGYLVCTQLSTTGGGSSCDSPTTGIADMLKGCLVTGNGPCTIYGGTSVSSPIFAGMVALLNQDVVAAGIQTTPGLGNINPTLYTLAAANATNGAFNPVNTASSGIYSSGAFCDPGQPISGITGDPWPAAMQCPSSGTNLVGFNTYDFDATTHYNLVTGLGSVNASHLAAAWVATGISATTTSLISDLNPAAFGATVNLTANVSTVGTDPLIGTLTFYNGTTVIGTPVTLTGGATGVGLATASLPAGTDSITAVYGGDPNNAASTSTPLSQVIDAPAFNVSTPTTPAPALAGQTTTSTFTVTPTGSGVTLFGANVTLSCNGLPDATVTCQFSTNPIPAGAMATTETLTIKTSGPNTGAAGTQRKADNRSPWLPLALPLAGIVIAGFAGRKMSKHSAAAALGVSLILLGLLVACGGGNSSSSPPPAVSVSVSQGTPSSLYPNYSNGNDMWQSQTAAFTATVANTTNTAVTWTASSGTIASTGNDTATYTAPMVAAGLPAHVTITATSAADTTKTGTATETLTPATVPGTYNITATATEGSTTNSTSTIALTVQ